MGRFDWLELPDSGYEKSLKHEDSLQRFDPNYYLELGYKQLNEGEFENALRNYSRVLHLDRSNLSAWIGQVKALIQMGELTEAKVWTEKAITFFPKAPELVAAKAFLLYKSGLIEDAMAYCDNALKGHSDSYYPWLVRGEILLSQQKIELANYCFDKAKELKEEPTILFEIGEAYLNNEMFVQAVEYIKGALKIQPASCFRWLKLGKAYEKLTFYDEAKLSYKKALELKPDFQEARDCLGTLEGCSKDIFSIVCDSIKRLFFKR